MDEPKKEPTIGTSSNNEQASKTTMLLLEAHYPDNMDFNAGQYNESCPGDESLDNGCPEEGSEEASTKPNVSRWVPQRKPWAAFFVHGGPVSNWNPERPVGFCHFAGHPGQLNTTHIFQHQCIRKNCPYLSKNKEHPFWQNISKKEKAKEEAKQKRQNKKIQQKELEAHMQKLKEEFQGYADETNSELLVIRV